MSLVEVLIATLVLMVIALSILPLLLRSLANNNRGAEATQSSVYAASALDRLLQLPFDKGEMIVADGLTEAVRVESQTLAANDPTPELILRPPSERWQVGEPEDPSSVEWQRTTRVQQFNLTDLEPDPGSGMTSFEAPLLGGTAPQLVHLKMVEVRIETGRQSGVSGVGQDMTIRVLKAF